MKQLSSELASRDAAQSPAITAVSYRLNRLERSRSDRSDRESANVQSSVPLLNQPATVVVESRESRLNRANTTPPEDAVLDPMRYCGLLPVPSAGNSKVSDYNRRDASRPFLLFPDRHAGFVATALPPPHAAFASLPPPSLFQPLPSHSSVPPADAVIDVREPILPVTRFPVCVAAVLDAVNAEVYFSIVSECRGWNRLGSHKSRDTVESRIETALHKNIKYQNRAFLADAVISHAL